MASDLSSTAATADAKAAGLVYVTDDRPALSRRPNRSGHFSYFDAAGKRITEPSVIERIRKVGIPPAWTDVWIAASPNAHIQATGRDARGRKQYRYHPDFRAVRDGAKFEHLVAFAEVLPKLRRRVTSDMNRPGLPREKVIASVVHLLDTTLIRIGNGDYARSNGSFGLTTLRDRHVSVAKGELRFNFTGKSGKTWRLRVQDRRVARIVRSCQELPGQHLFQYLDEAGQRQEVGSADVNAWLRETTGAEITAKEFRTWNGTVLAATTLATYPPADTATLAKANLREGIEFVADRLGNTATICRRCYVHPAIVDEYLAGSLRLDVRGQVRGLRAEEAAVLRLLRRLLRATPKQPAKSRK
jgi:DNA topoisomerase-1